MNARKRGQKQLANDWALGEGCVAVNDRVWFEDRDGVRSGSPGRLPAPGPHGSGHADFPHPALRITVSLPVGRWSELL